MPTIDLTLSGILIPDLRAQGYTPQFGTMVQNDGVNMGGLSTMQVNNNILMAFSKMRAIPIASTIATTQVEYDAKLYFSSELNDTEELTLGYATYQGCSILISNVSDCDQTVKLNTVQLPESDSSRVPRTITLEPKSLVQAIFDGTNWQVVTTKISTVAPTNPTTGDIWVETEAPQNNQNP